MRLCDLAMGVAAVSVIAACSPSADVADPPTPAAAVAPVSHDLPASKDEFLARLKRADPSVDPKGAWLPADRETAALNARVGAPVEFHRALGGDLVIRAYETPDGSLDEIGIDLRHPRSANDQANTALVDLAYSASKTAKVSEVNWAIDQLNDARRADQAATVKLGEVKIGIYPGEGRSFSLWAVPIDKEEVRVASLRRTMQALQKNDDKTEDEAMANSAGG